MHWNDPAYPVTAQGNKMCFSYHTGGCYSNCRANADHTPNRCHTAEEQAQGVAFITSVVGKLDGRVESTSKLCVMSTSTERPPPSDNQRTTKRRKVQPSPSTSPRPKQPFGPPAPRQLHAKPAKAVDENPELLGEWAVRNADYLTEAAWLV